jgi:uncharacterized metal-binding protein YceD (DUF177 family)
MIQVHLHQIPDADFLKLSGEADPTLLGLEEANMEPVGPLFYELEVGLSDGGLFATGSLSQKVRMTCVGCLEPFEYLIETKTFAMQQELSGSELVDLTEAVREDIQLLLPMHPRCTLGGNQCPAQFPQRVIPPIENSEVRSVWSALDNIKH